MDKAQSPLIIFIPQSKSKSIVKKISTDTCLASLERGYKISLMRLKYKCRRKTVKKRRKSKFSYYFEVKNISKYKGSVNFDHFEISTKYEILKRVN